MRSVRVLVAIWLLLVSLSSAAQTAPRSLGINLDSVVDWSNQWTFVDVFKTARSWISQCEGCGWGEGAPLNLTPEGWVASLEPLQSAWTVVMTTPGAFPTGAYTLLYNGEGTFDFPLGGAQVLTSDPGRLTVDVNGSGAVWIAITDTNPANPLRDIRFIMPGFEATYEQNPFHPLFLERVAPFSTLRFMDLMATNHSTIRTWEDRPTPSDMTQAEKGVALEYLVALANVTGKAPWFTMPHMADDTYIREFAAYVRDNLNPSLPVYVEYSNETWNGIFEQAQYVIDQGIERALGDDEYHGGALFYSERAVEIFALWEEVFGGTDRLVRVLGSWAAVPWYSEQIVTHKDAYLHVDALAIAPYFGGPLGDPETAEEVAAYSIGEFETFINAHINGEVSDWMEQAAEITTRYDLRLLAYEGGQHLSGFGGAENNDALTEALIGANRAPFMFDAYMTYLDRWEALGGETFVAFSFVGEPSKWGSWGVMESQAQPVDSAHKYRALLQWAAGG